MAKKKGNTSNKKENSQGITKKSHPLKPLITIGFLTLGVGFYFVIKAIYTLYIMPIDDDKSGWPLYQKYCASCHGLSAEGQDIRQPKGGTYPDGSFIAPALNGLGNSWLSSDEQLFIKIKKGSTIPNSPMMGFEEQLTDEGIYLVIGFFKSKWPALTRQIHENRFPNIQKE